MSIDGDSVIEHKTFPVKVAVRIFLQISKDAAFELVNVFESFLLHRDQRFFAPNATGAVHHHFFALGNVAL